MEYCSLRYIGENPIDLRTDEVTTVNQEQKIVVKDVAINGNVKDLVKDRGIFNSKGLDGTDYNTITKQGVYSIPLSGSTNGPGYAAKLLVYSVFESPFVTQVAIDVGSVAIKCRYKSDTVNWTPWETVIFNTDTATTSKAGLVMPDDSSLKIVDASSGKVSVEDVLYNGTISLIESGALGKARYITSSESFNVDTDDFDLVLVNTSNIHDGVYPSGFSGFIYVRQLYYSRTSSSVIGNRMQLAFAYNANHTWSRYYIDGVWSDWVKFVKGTDLATTSKAGIVQLNNTVTSTSTTQAATANAVKMAYDKAVEASESTGRSETADKLTTARTIQTNLASTTAGSFDGSKNITIGVSGVLPVANGGTGNSNGMMTVNLPKNQTRYNLLSAKSSIATHPIIEICEPFATAPEGNGGKNVSFGSDGATILASGESGSGLMEELKSTDTEQLYLISDSGITMYVGADIYENKKAITISSAGAITTPSTIKATGFTGNATSASKLATARTIGIGGIVTGTATSFNGAANITIDTTALNLEDTGIVGELPITHGGTGRTDGKAPSLVTARTIGITGVVTGTATAFDGSKNITIDTTTLNLEDTGVTGELPIAHGGTGRTDGKAPSLVTKRTIDGVSFDGSANITHFGECSTDATTAAKVVSVPNFVLATGAEVTVQFTVTNTAASPTLNVNNTGAKAIVYRNAAISAGYLAANHVYKFVYDGTNYELIGDVDTNTTYTAASATPKAPGTAAVGTSTKYAREDHVHPLQTTVSGNAGSATKLATARTIDGVSFNGSANITHYGTCSTAADTAAKTVAVTSFTLATGAVVYVRFTVTNTAASPTLNVNSTGAKAIRYRNAAISAGYLAANRTYCFIYDGTYYQLVGDIDTNTKYTAASETPKAPGTAAVGTSSKYAREDHVHPLQTTVSGNAGTATKLATARTISLTGVVEGSVSFDGSKNVSITTTADGIGGSIPIGGIIAFSGTFGGTNNRFPIPLGSTTPDTNWCLCDGTKTNNLNVPDLRGRMILGASSTHTAGTKGGSETHTHSISGTVGAHTLTVTQIPSHNHTFTSSKGDKDFNNGGGNTWWGWNNSRTTTVSSSGGSGSHTHDFSNTSTTKETLLPPYYALSYIMRIS